MIFIPWEQLKAGMVVAHDVDDIGSCFALISKGQKLTEASIRKLHKHEISGVYIESDFCNDLILEPLVPPEIKKQTLNDLRKVFVQYTRTTTLNASSYKEVRKTAENLLMHALSQEECLYNVNEIKGYDDYTYTHSMYVGILSALIGMKMNLTKAQQLDLCTCGLLHDTGKLDIDIKIINKPDKLDAEEFAIIKSHPDKAVKRLSGCRSISASVLAGIRTHHEMVDGAGYPLGLHGDEIPLYGRIIALADVYDALTSKRQYRRAWSSSEAIEYMMGKAHTHFDITVLQAFLKTVAAYPIGTIVKLSNGDTAVVIKNYSENVLRPKVKVFSGVSPLGCEIDLSNDYNYLSVTVESVLKPEDKLPQILV